MKILLTGFNADIQGALAGSVAKQTRAGLVIQTKGLRPKGRAKGGTDTRSMVQYFSRLWKTLSIAQQHRFADVGQLVSTSDKWGRAVPLTGWQVFLRMQLNKWEAGQGTGLISPTGWNPPNFYISGLTLTAGSGLKRLFWEDYGAVNLRYSVLYTSPAMPASSGAWLDKLQFLETMSITTNSFRSFQNIWGNKYGLAPTGCRIGCRLKFISSDNFADSGRHFISGICV